MKKVFISHPFRGDPEGNMAKVSHICKLIALSCPEVIPISPLHSLSFLNDEESREYSLAWCREVIGMCDEVWVYGDWEKSEGCQLEVEWARELGKPILFDGKEADN